MGHINSVNHFIRGCPFPDDLDDFSLRWMIGNALRRLTGLKKRTESPSEAVLDVYLDDKGLASGVSMLSGRGDFMPRFQGKGVINVRTQPMDLNRAMLSILPEESRGGRTTVRARIEQVRPGVSS